MLRKNLSANDVEPRFFAILGFMVFALAVDRLVILGSDLRVQAIDPESSLVHTPGYRPVCRSGLLSCAVRKQARGRIGMPSPRDLVLVGSGLAAVCESYTRGVPARTHASENELLCPVSWR